MKILFTVLITMSLALPISAKRMIITPSSESIIKTAKKCLGCRYHYGGTSKKGFDCSGFTNYVFKKHGKKLPRTSRDQSKIGKKVSKKHLRKGDLLFFSSRKTRGVAHVGIYIGGGKFIHASSGKHKVTITKLDKGYYRQHYKWAKRL
jgi:cell wall-associated NlpC family hydrolase